MGVENMKIEVDCEPDHLKEQTPHRLQFNNRSVEVVDVLDRWLGADHGYFKVRGEDNATYILRHDVASGRWELVMFDRERRSSAG